MAMTSQNKGIQASSLIAAFQDGAIDPRNAPSTPRRHHRKSEEQ